MRFYAALSVVVQHVSYSPHDWFGTPLLPVTLERFFLNGTDAVNLFFILSGFLITYLLLAEHEQTGRVNIRHFYVRRAIRIYPVYFVFIAAVYLLLQPPYAPALLPLLIFFMGNLAFVLLFPFPPLEHLWSIGVEEQYYLLAPLMVRHRKSLARILIAIIGGYWLLLVAGSVLPPGQAGAFLLMSRFDLIALGALTAYAHFHQWAVLRFLRHPLALALSAVIVIYAVVFVQPPTDFYYTTMVGLAFTILIYNLAVRPEMFKFSDSQRLEYLGRLSYSMYVYHPLFVLLFYTVFYSRLSLEQYQLAAYPIIIAVTIAVSFLSYRFLEQPFLRAKERFKRIEPDRVAASEAAMPFASQQTELARE